jgi:hypothetical protein
LSVGDDVGVDDGVVVSDGDGFWDVCTWVQLDANMTMTATTTADTAPLKPPPSLTLCAANCMGTRIRNRALAKFL